VSPYILGEGTVTVAEGRLGNAYHA